MFLNNSSSAVRQRISNDGDSRECEMNLFISLKVINWALIAIGGSGVIGLSFLGLSLAHENDSSAYTVWRLCRRVASRLAIVSGFAGAFGDVDTDL